jgi:general secretion pathway protein I
MRRIRSRPAPGSAAGFTLLEVLLAFVVFALSFAVVLEILSGSMRNTVRAREYTEAALIAQSVMDQLGLGIPLEAGIEVEGEEGEYRWEVGIYLFAGLPEDPRSLELSDLTRVELLEVECLVSWGQIPRERSTRFSTVRAVLAERGGGRS